MNSVELWLLLAKLGISACVVVTASFVIEKSGPLVGALIASLPLSSGPVYVFLAIEHGPEFLAQTALGSLPAMAGIAAFQLAYVRLAQSWRTFPALTVSMLVWAVVAGAIRAGGFGFPVLAALAIGTYLVAYALVQPYLRWSSGVAAPKRWWDVPFRALVVVLVTLTALLAGRLAGAQAAGLFALMPVVFAPLVLILQPRIGGPNTAVVLGIALPGMIGMTVAQSAVYLSAVALGSTAALLLGLAISMSWNLGILYLKRAR